MINQYRSSVGMRHRHRNKIPFILFFIVVACIVYYFRYPVAHTFSQIRFRTLTFIRTDAAQVLSRDAYILSLEGENQKLRDSIESMSSTTKKDYVSYPVISAPPFSPYDTLVVSIESSEYKPNVGAYVQSLDGLTIGKVETVDTGVAAIRLFSSSGFKNQVKITSGSSTISATAEGMGGGNFYIKLPQNTKVSVGNPVNWLGKRNVFLGAIEYIEQDIGSAFNHVYFKLPVDVSKIIYVSIEKSHN